MPIYKLKSGVLVDPMKATGEWSGSGKTIYCSSKGTLYEADEDGAEELTPEIAARRILDNGGPLPDDLVPFLDDLTTE